MRKSETRKCACGCGATVTRTFRQGHDQRLISNLIRDGRVSDHAQALAMQIAARVLGPAGQQKVADGINSYRQTVTHYRGRKYDARRNDDGTVTIDLARGPINVPLY